MLTLFRQDPVQQTASTGSIDVDILEESPLGGSARLTQKLDSFDYLTNIFYLYSNQATISLSGREEMTAIYNKQLVSFCQL